MLSAETCGQQVDRCSKCEFVCEMGEAHPMLKHFARPLYECSLKFYQRYLVEYLITSFEHNIRNMYFALLGPGA